MKDAHIELLVEVIGEVDQSDGDADGPSDGLLLGAEPEAGDGADG